MEKAIRNKCNFITCQFTVLAVHIWAYMIPCQPNPLSWCYCWHLCWHLSVCTLYCTLLNWYIYFLYCASCTLDESKHIPSSSWK